MDDPIDDALSGSESDLPAYSEPPPPYPGPPLPTNTADWLARIDRRAKKETRRIKRYFRHRNTPLRRFTLEEVMGHGADGVVCKIKFTHGIWPFRRTERYAIKRALSRDQDHAIAREIRLLRSFRGALHIVQPFRLRSKYRDPLDSAPGRTLMMQLLENGSLHTFLTRCQTTGRPLPNRFLLRVFMCLVRSCIAMAWPPRKPRGARATTERPPSDPARLQQASHIRHGDMHFGNLMFGGLDEEEHSVIPVLKLIDFGRATPIDDPWNNNLAEKGNLYDIGLIMRALITGVITRNPPVAAVGFRVDGEDVNLASAGADLSRPSYPDLDDNIRGMVALLLAIDPDRRPQIDQLHDKLSTWVERGSNYYKDYPRGRGFERTVHIRAIVQGLLLNADN
ncbi:kinase-like domain-containing protein [Whalleya microplaca]|nr:kinase-like domain-containing protein [Whalleya microplaca]